MSMTKTERQELKSIVRQQFRVLRQEVEHRATEVANEAEHAINNRYTDEDEAWEAATTEAHRLVLEANTRINDLYRNLPGRYHEDDIYIGFRPPRRNQEKRADLRRLATSDIETKVADATLRLARQEADILRDLSLGALESEEARGFLAGIPAAAELVPLARLAELEADYNKDRT